MSAAIELQVEGITLHTGSSVLVEDLSLRASGGQILGITGASGSGKSSLLHVLAGLQPPAAGRVLAGDVLTVPLWRDPHVSLVLQNPWLVPVLSAYETVTIPLLARGLAREEVTERGRTTLSALGLGDHLGQLVDHLSGGQRQRVAVARALAARPTILFADEPAAALDPQWREVVFDQIRIEADRGALVLLTTSDPDAIALCDRVLTLQRPAWNVSGSA